MSRSITQRRKMLNPALRSFLSFFLFFLSFLFGSLKSMDGAPIDARTISVYFSLTAFKKTRKRRKRISSSFLFELFLPQTTFFNSLALSPQVIAFKSRWRPHIRQECLSMVCLRTLPTRSFQSISPLAMALQMLMSCQSAEWALWDSRPRKPLRLLLNISIGLLSGCQGYLWIWLYQFVFPMSLFFPVPFLFHLLCQFRSLTTFKNHETDQSPRLRMVQKIIQQGIEPLMARG